MACHPDFVAVGPRQERVQLPVRSTRHGIAGFQATRIRQELDGLARDRRRQPVADTRQRLDDVLRLIGQCPPQLADRIGQHRLDHDPPGPDRGQQLVLGDRFARVPEQVLQHLQRLVLQFDILTCNAQLPACFIEFGVAECPAIRPRASGAFPPCIQRHLTAPIDGFPG